jgi:hypothetical protein
VSQVVPRRIESRNLRSLIDRAEAHPFAACRMHALKRQWKAVHPGA